MSWTVCPFTGKHGYLDEHDAIRALHRVQGRARRQRKAGRRGIRRQERRHYYHPQCGRWHLTSTPSRVLSDRTAGREPQYA